MTATEAVAVGRAAKDAKLVVEVAAQPSAAYQDRGLVITVVRLLFNSGRFRRHKRCAVNKCVMFIRSTADVGDIRLVLFTERDSRLEPLE